MFRPLKKQIHKKSGKDRPTIHRSSKPNLFDNYLPECNAADKELHLLCREVIERECGCRIQGSRKQDAIAILNCATDQISVSATHHNIIDYYDQFYNRIRAIDRLERLK